MTERRRFADRVAVVTGASRGLGRAIAVELATEGASVVVNGRDAAAVDEVVEAIRASGGRAMAAVADVSDVEAVARMLAACERTLGPPDVLVNNAGGGSFVRARYLEDSAEGEWQTLIAINLIGTMNCCKAAIPSMKARRRGRIVNMASSAGRATARLSNPVYCAAKAGIVGFTRQLAADLGPHGITVNAVAPGTTRTDRVDRRLAALGAKGVQRVLDGIPFGHVAEVSEVVAPVLFLASDEASYITGVTLDVNGGFYMG